MQNNLLKDTTLIFLSDLLIKIFGFILIGFIGIILDKEQIADFNFILFYAEVLTILCGYGFMVGYLKISTEYNHFEVLKTYLFINFIIIFTLLILITMLPDNIFQHKFFVMILSLGLTFNLYSKFYFISMHKIKFYLFMIIINLIIASFFLYVFFENINLDIVIVSRALLYITNSIFILIFILKFNSFKINKEILSKVLKIGTPVVLSTLIMLLNIYAGRIVLNFYISKYEVGIYSFFALIISGILVLINSFQNIWFRNINNLAIEVKYNFKKIYQKTNQVLFNINILNIIGSISVLLMSIFLFDKNFELYGYFTYRGPFFILLTALPIAFLYILFYPMIFIYNLQKYLIYFSFCILIFAFFLNFSMIYFFSMKGASISVFIIELVSVILILSILKYKNQDIIIVSPKNKLLIYFYIFIITIIIYIN